MVKNPPDNAGDTGSIPGSGRCPGGGNGNPIPVSLAGESHGQRSLLGLQSMALQSQTGLSACAPSAPQGLSHLFLLLLPLQPLGGACLLVHNKVLYFHCSSYQNVSKFKPGVRGDWLGPRPPGGRMRKRRQKTPLTPLPPPWPCFIVTVFSHDLHFH